MTATSGYGRLAPDSDILTPLPLVLHRGMTAVAVLASLSFFASTVTVLYLTFKLVRWHIKQRREGKNGPRSPGVDLSLGLAPRHFGGGGGQHGRGENDRKAPNQFLILLFNLLIADMHQAGSFLISGVWLAKDMIEVGSPGCVIQGWLVSAGDVAGGLFLSAIAIHTYLTVVWNRKPPQQAVYGGVVGIWVFTYFISALGIAVTQNGKSGGGFYVRAGAWCWINVHYENLRLLTHYLFIFISLATVSILYTLIFLNLRRRRSQPNLELSTTQSRADDQNLPKSSSDFRTKVTQINPTRTSSNKHNGHHPAFLIYPVIYVLCTAPLALGRIATMAGASVPLGYFCAAGALITSNGWLDVLLWGLTRRALLFGSDVDTEDVGLETFAFMRTPPERKFGNIVWVQGASRGIPEEDEDDQDHRRADDAKDGFGWWRGAANWRRTMTAKRPSAGNRRNGSMSGQLRSHKRLGSRSISQESLRGKGAGGGIGDMAIQMDIVTSVEVEVDMDKVGNRHREYSLSVDSNAAEKDVHHQ